MKTYIAPVARAINLESEALIATSMNKSEAQVQSAWSNEREQTPSQSIWGDED